MVLRKRQILLPVSSVHITMKNHGDMPIWAQNFFVVYLQLFALEKQDTKGI